MNSITILSFLHLLSHTLGSTLHFTELESLNPTEKAALGKLKSSVSSILPHDYMKEDWYLIKWLQAREFSAPKAEEMIKAALKWREKVKINEWEDPKAFEDLEKKGEYPLFDDGFDRTGRPVGEAFFGDWNVRSLALQGKIKHLTHYCLRGIERSTKRIRQAQAEGKNVTQMILLVNMDGFNIVNQGCPTCMGLHLGFVDQYEKYFPNVIHRTILVNTPESFETILKLIRPLMSPQTREGLKVFGHNKNEWKPYLDEMIDPKEISDWYDPHGKDRKAQ